MLEVFDVPLSLLLVILGIGLSISEALAPGAHFIVVGVALLVAGLVGLFVPFVSGPLALAALVLLGGGLALFVYREFDFYGGSNAGATTDSDSLRGSSGRVTERVTETDGEIKLEGGGFNPFYSARSIDSEIPEGTEVMVVDPGGGNVVTVEALDVIEDDIDRELKKEREAEESHSVEESREPAPKEPDTEGV
jgi:membrane protein implicated in regulation of membrane protease activity